MTQEQVKVLSERKTWYKEQCFHDLWDKIESFKKGSLSVIVSVTKNEAELLLDRGILFGRTDKMMIGEPCGCHRNSAALFMENKDKYRVATGYALSEDDLWREHSWIVKPIKKGNIDSQNPKDFKVIETTEERVKYFGYIMNYEECLEFEG